jgi:hypothetical protein
LAGSGVDVADIDVIARFLLGDDVCAVDDDDDDDDLCTTTNDITHIHANDITHYAYTCTGRKPSNNRCPAATLMLRALALIVFVSLGLLIDTALTLLTALILLIVRSVTA